MFSAVETFLFRYGKMSITAVSGFRKCINNISLLANDLSATFLCITPEYLNSPLRFWAYVTTDAILLCTSGFAEKFVN